MNGFKLNSQVDANKFFLIRCAQLAGRIDPRQYHHEPLSAIVSLREANQNPVCSKSNCGVVAELSQLEVKSIVVLVLPLFVKGDIIAHIQSIRIQAT